jgi:hypothetical protein
MLVGAGAFLFVHEVGALSTIAIVLRAVSLGVHESGLW